MSSPRTSHDYWVQTRRPLNCLVFLMPLLIVYEAGVLWLGADAKSSLRNGADVFLRTGLHQLGFESLWLLPVLVTAALLSWQVLGRYPWRISRDTMAGMFGESVLFAFCLLVAGQLQDIFVQRLQPALSMSAESKSLPADVIAFVGAGVYEEVLFRLCLLPTAYCLLRLLAMGSRSAAVGAVVVTSLLFAASHHVGPGGESFQPASFAFRAMAGLFFAGLFVLRGFGITVGAHAAYDLLVGVLLMQADS